MAVTAINTCLAQLQTNMNAAFVTGSGGDGSADYVYDYRTFPDRLNVTISLSYQGRGREERTDIRGRPLQVDYYDVTAVVGSQMALDSDGKVTETAVRNADQALNTIENGIYTLLAPGGAANNNSYWHSVGFPTPSRRPPSFVEAPSTRYAEIPFRLYLTGGSETFGG